MKPKLKLKQRRSQDRRRRILDAATRTFGRHGIAGASLTDVARAAKVPLPCLYDYFGNKQALVASVPAGNFAELYELLARDPGVTAAERLHRLYAGTFAYIAANPAWGRVFFLEIWPSVLAARPAIRRAIDDYARRYVRILQDGIAGGEFRRDLDPYLAMSLLLGAMGHLTAVWLLYGQRFDLRVKGDAALTMLTHTLEGGSHEPTVRRRRVETARGDS